MYTQFFYPVPVKQRTHRRTHSYDTSQASVSEFVTFPSQHSRPPPTRHHSLSRETTPSRMSSYSNSSTISEVPSHVPIISTQDSGITSSFDSKLHSPSGHSLCTDPGSSVSKHMATASDTGSEVMFLTVDIRIITLTYVSENEIDIHVFLCIVIYMHVNYNKL